MWSPITPVCISRRAPLAHESAGPSSQIRTKAVMHRCATYFFSRVNLAKLLRIWLISGVQDLNSRFKPWYLLLQCTLSSEVNCLHHLSACLSRLAVFPSYIISYLIPLKFGFSLRILHVFSYLHSFFGAYFSVVGFSLQSIFEPATFIMQHSRIYFALI